MKWFGIFALLCWAAMLSFHIYARNSNTEHNVFKYTAYDAAVDECFARGGRFYGAWDMCIQDIQMGNQIEP